MPVRTLSAFELSVRPHRNVGMLGNLKHAGIQEVRRYRGSPTITQERCRFNQINLDSGVSEIQRSLDASHAAADNKCAFAHRMLLWILHMVCS